MTLCSYDLQQQQQVTSFQKVCFVVTADHQLWNVADVTCSHIHSFHTHTYTDHSQLLRTVTETQNHLTKHKKTDKHRTQGSQSNSRKCIKLHTCKVTMVNDWRKINKTFVVVSIDCKNFKVGRI